MPVMPALTPAELQQAAAKAKSVDELTAIGVACFKPWADAIEAGESAATSLRNVSRGAGYTKLFTELNEQGLDGTNSFNGKNHVFQQCHYDVLYSSDKSAGEKAATRVLEGESAVIPVDEYMGAVLKLLKSSEPSDLIAGIAAATGRRTIEVLQIGKFAEVKDAPTGYLEDVDPAYVYRFQNPAKKRNYGVPDDEKPSFSSTSLVQAADLLAAWKSLKALPEVKGYLKEAAQVKKANGEVAARDYFNRKWKDSLGAVMESRFSFLPGKLTEKGTRKAPTPKDLRPAFAQMTYVRDVARDDQGQPLKGSEILFKGRVLGHYIEGSKADETLRRLSSTLSYYGYRTDRKPNYPESMTENIVRPACYESDREWLNSLVEGKTQAETFRYLRKQHEALQAEVLELRQKVREQAKPATKAAPQGDLERAVAALTEQVAVLTGSGTKANKKPAYHVADTPSVKSARLDVPVKKSEAQMKAHQWLDIVMGEVKDRNRQADGDIWQMWALSPRMLKDISGVSQKLVKEFWSENEAEIQALHEQWGLDNQHNRRRGMKGGKVADDFNLTRPIELL